MPAKLELVRTDPTPPLQGHEPASTLGTPGPAPAKPLPTIYQELDRVAHAAYAKATFGLAPSVLAEAWLDWAAHLAISPGKRLQLADTAIQKLHELWTDALSAGAARPEGADDRRFAGDAWRQYPFNLLAAAHRLNWQWWQDATRGVHGVDPAHENLMAFVAGQMVDLAAPSNFAATNPDVIAATIAKGGQNLVQGAKALAAELGREMGMHQPPVPQAFEVGRNLAVTPGKVVYRNALIELIQYAPATGSVHPEPVLIVPAWIMKYYILDLSPENSFVRHLVGQGFTVFVVSWKNPAASDRDLGMDDYRRLGVLAAAQAVQAITSAPRLHAVGYCLGGTLLAITAAAMARDGDMRFATTTFLAAQIDFTEAGPLRLFINESEVTLIEDMMAETGYLSSNQMAGAFALLRARDLIWAPAIEKYLLGEAQAPFDLAAWNMDATRMPYRMHSEYLRRLFLNNDLAEGHYHVDDRAISVADIRAPMFVVGTEQDQVAPWQSVHKFHLFAKSEITFVLTSGGHNAGIVSEPGHRGRHFRIAASPADTPFRDQGDWLAETAPQDGSWWVPYSAWLAAHSGPRGAPPPLGAPTGPYVALCDAPGTYVMQR